MFAALCTADFKLDALFFARNFRNFASEFKRKNGSKLKFQIKISINEPIISLFFRVVKGMQVKGLKNVNFYAKIVIFCSSFNWEK